MKRYIITGFKNKIWGNWEIITTAELLEKRAAERNITITSISEI